MFYSIGCFTFNSTLFLYLQSNLFIEHTVWNEYFLGRVIYDIFSHTLVTIKAWREALREEKEEEEYNINDINLPHIN